MFMHGIFLNESEFIFIRNKIENFRIKNNTKKSKTHKNIS